MSQTARPVASSGATGTTCQAPGPYRSNRNAKVVVFLASEEAGACTSQQYIVDGGRA